MKQHLCRVAIAFVLLSLLSSVQAASESRLEELAQRLVQAAGKGDVKKIRILLRAGADANRPAGKPDNRRWPLDEAMKHLHFAAADALRAGGAGFSESSTVFTAVSEANVPAIEYALKRCVKPDYFDTSSGFTLLTFCFNGSIMDEEPSPSVTRQNRAKRVNALRALLRGGANPNRLDKTKTGPLHDAGHAAFLSWVKILLEFKANPNLADGNGDTPLILSLAPVTEDAGYSLQTDYSDADDTLERRAVRLLLLEKGAKVNVKNKRGSAPIHLASANNFATAVDDLVQRGANVNERGFNDATPLHVAMRYGAFDVATKLLALGADAKLKDKAGRSVLDYQSSQTFTPLWELDGHQKLHIDFDDSVKEGRAKMVKLLQENAP